MQHYATARVTLEYGRKRWNFANESAIRSPLATGHFSADFGRRPEKSLGRSSRTPMRDLFGYSIAEFGEILSQAQNDMPRMWDFSGRNSKLYLWAKARIDRT